MPTIFYVDIGGERRGVEVTTGTTAMRAAFMNGVDGIVAECGGAAMCSTCHVYADDDRLPPMDEIEDEMLDGGTARGGQQARLPDQRDRRPRRTRPAAARGADLMTGVVIIGAGQAGFQVACSLRDKGFTGPIDLVGDEPGLPYQRPPLSKQFLTGAGTDAVTLRPASYFAAQSITLHNSRAVALDRSARTVSLASGARLPYTRLVLATGAANRPLRVPGADLAGVHDLRTLADASVLRSRLESPGNLVVVGAGFIGMEVAAVARSCGHDVTVVESLDRVLARAVSADVSAAVQRHHAGLGTRFRLGTAVTEILGADGRVTGVRCGDDVLDADLVVVGVGVVPSEDLARDSGLEVSDGILVGAHLSTSDPAIFAIGDCARHGPVRLESVQNATDQARCVAQAIAGRGRPTPHCRGSGATRAS